MTRSTQHPSGFYVGSGAVKMSPSLHLCSHLCPPLSIGRPGLLVRRCAQCLGLLGAIDPSRVQPELPRPSPFKYDPQHFLVCLVQDHLVRVLQTASDISQLEMTSYALQQILQKFNANRLKTTSAIMTVSGDASHVLAY